MNKAFILVALLESQLWQEGSYEFGFVCPSVLPSIRKFSWNWAISFFLKLIMVLGVHLGLCVTEPDFSRKNHLWAKMTKNGQN